MRIHDTITQPWIIKHTMLDNIIEKARAHLAGPKKDLKGLVEASDYSDDDYSNGKYKVQGSKAIIQINGVITKKPSYFERYMYGARSIETYIENFLAAIDDSSINHIILDMDTPGGTVPGVQEFANLIFNNRDKKKITAFTSGMVASAGYWLGSAAHEMILSGDTAEVGSIGVYTVHEDWTKWNEKNGINVSIIKAGKYKAAQHPDNKMTKDQKDYVQGQIDYLYDVFTRDVAKFRGVSQEIVLSNMADGKIFIGQQAIDAGLADKMMTLTELLEIPDNEKNIDIYTQAGESDNNIKVENPGVEIDEKTEVDVKVEKDEKEIKTEDKKMSLKEILAADPLAQAEVDKLVSDAEDKVKASFNAKGLELAKFMTEENDPAVRAAAVKAYSGEGSVEAVNTLSAMDTMLTERTKSDAAKIESDKIGDVKADGQEVPKVSDDGIIRTDADHQAALDRTGGAK